MLKYILLAVGGDINIIPDSDEDQMYYGHTLTGGLAKGIPGGEFHVEWGKLLQYLEQSLTFLM